MRYSLISRDWIADCAEIMHEAYSAVSNTCDQTHENQPCSRTKIT